MDITGRIASGAVDLEAVAGDMAQPAFSHL
jgi:hypothetical protein